MTSADIHLTIILTFVSVLGLPTLALLLRIQARWTSAADRLADVADDLNKHVEDDKRINTEMIGQMREDRKATNERLTYLERNCWGSDFRSGGGRRAAPPRDSWPEPG